MKNIDYIFTILVIILMSSCNMVSEEEVKMKLDKNLEDYCNAFRKSDNNTILKFHPAPMVVDKMGGFEVFRKKLKEEDESYFNNGVTYKDVTYLSVSNPLNSKFIKFKQNSNDIHALIPIKTIIYTPTNTITLQSYLYCLSEDYGESWVILSYKTLKNQYPNFPFAFHPENEPEAIQEDCNFFKMDVFGNNVCIDRFIETAEYEIRGLEGKNVFKVIKKEKPTISDYDMLKSVELAVDAWKSELSIKSDFSTVSEQTIPYLESGLDQFYLYDIYGIPFSYKSEGKVFQDTLPGYFEKEKYKLYKSEKNTELLQKKTNKFVVLYDSTDF